MRTRFENANDVSRVRPGGIGCEGGVPPREWGRTKEEQDEDQKQQDEDENEDEDNDEH